jgi:drug/metabolite transporter (DMT)-like permease
VDSVSEVRRLRRQAIPWVLGNAIFGLVLGVSSYQWALSQLPAGVVLAVTSLTPLTIIPLAWWMEGDRPTIRAVAGALVAVSGVVGLVLTW